MQMLTDREIASMRKVAEAHLIDSATIQRSTKTSDGQGGFNSTSSQVGDAIACLLSPLKARETDQEVGDRNVKYLRRVLTYPTSVDLRMTDTVVVQGESWDVVNLMEPRSINLLARAELVRAV